MTILDLDKFPVVKNNIGLACYLHYEEFNRLKVYQEIYERVYGCSYFLYSTYRNDESYPFLREKACLRGALSEFVSLSEVLKTSNENRLQNLAIENLHYPLFHFCKLLRETNFHISSFTHGPTQTDVISTYNNAPSDMGLSSFTNIIIDNCDLTLFNGLWNLKHYKTDQLSEMIEWVNINQCMWGINHILDLALRQYCEHLETNLFSI